MAYVNLNTLDILEKKSPLKESDGEYFECDEEMAGILIVLNQKGYSTLFSCSGHLYDEISNTLEEDNAGLTEEELRELYPGVLSIRTDDQGVRTLTLRQNLALKSYIVFAPDILLPSVPDEWRLDGNVLSHNYYWDPCFQEIPDLAALKRRPFEFYRRRAELLSVLFDWAEALPEYRPSEAADPESDFRKAHDSMERMRQSYRNGPLL